VSVPTATGKPERPRLLESIWFKGAMLLALVEGILVAVDVIPRWVAVGIAIAILAAYFLRGRAITDPSARQALWALALAQAVVLLIPLVTWILSAAVIVVLAVIAVLLVVVLIADR
jgi:hypothetical protein